MSPCLCPSCKEEAVISVEVKKYTTIYPACESDEWDEYVELVTAPDWEILEEDERSYVGEETWSCPNCGHVYMELYREGAN